MNQTFQNSAQVLSIGIFFTLMIIGLSATLPHALAAGLEAHGVPAATADHGLPPAAGLGPLRRLPRLQPGYAARPRARAPPPEPANAAALTGRSFFPHLIAEPFRSGLHEAFAFAIVACLMAAVASWSRGASTWPARRPSRGWARESRRPTRGDPGGLKARPRGLRKGRERSAVGAAALPPQRSAGSEQAAL